MPKSTAGYSGTPLPKKLGIKEGSTVALVKAPSDFAETLGRLPEDARLKRSLRGKFDLTIWFVRSKRDLERDADRILGNLGVNGIWIAWPKKASGIKTDVVEDTVRATGLARGVVDFKVCAIDDTWSGLKFQRRRA